MFRDLVEGVAAVQSLAREMGIDTRLDVHECPSGVRDPFAVLRGSTIPWGPARIILWGIGEPTASLKALREALGCGLEDAQTMLASLPCEPICDVDIAYAKKACDLLVRVGCDAEVVVPAKRSG